MKANPFLKQPAPRILKSRIIIEVDPASGKSNLRTEGVFTIPLVIDTLMAQTNSLWAQFIKGLTRPVVGPQGEPTYKDALSMEDIEKEIADDPAKTQ